MGEDEQKYGVRPARANLADVFNAAFTFARGVAEAAVEAWQVLETTAMAHSAYTMEKQEFAREAGKAIERLSKED
jgi:hypothetical protein